MFNSSLLRLVIEILFAMFSVYLLRLYMSIFFKRCKSKILWDSIFFVLFLWQAPCINAIITHANIRIIVTVLITIVAVSIVYEGRIWNKLIFSIIYNAMGMMIETLCGHFLIIYLTNSVEYWVAGSITSKILLLLITLGLKKVFTQHSVQQLPVFYSIMLILIPTGSMYIVNYIFMLSGSRTNMWSVHVDALITSFILLAINILIFYIYSKLIYDMELKQRNIIYEQQLELCEKHQQERESTMLQMRDVKHNMKNNLISILAYAKNSDYDKIINFVEELMGNGALNIITYSNTGNIVVDSLVNFWSSMAKKSDIDFSVKSSIPMQMTFQSADLCLILGNMLENAVEATQKVNFEKYIRLQIKYDRGNLLIFLQNSFNGIVNKNKSGKIISSKFDAKNHGIGLVSIYRTAEKYSGTVCCCIENSGTEFSMKVLLYGSEK